MALSYCPWLALKYGYQNERLRMSSDHSGHDSRPSDFPLTCALENNRRDGLLWVFLVRWSLKRHGCLLDHADSFELDHFDRYFHLIFWLKVNNDTVFKASILEHDRYEPPIGTRSCHKYLGLWQDHGPYKRHEWSNGSVSFSNNGWVLTFCQKTNPSRYVL